MPGQYQDGTIADGPNGPLIYRAGQGWVPLSSGGQIVAPNPLKMREVETGIDQNVASINKARVDAAKTAAALPYEPRKAAAEAAQAELQGKGLSPEVRQKALGQWSAANALDQNIADIKSQYAAGPGATSGLTGLLDFLPTPANQGFDKAANAARGTVRNALGLTGGENNTAAESRMNMGGYIPSASDYDPTILGSINRLEQLRDNARRQAILTLGGIPDANGNIVPASPAQIDQFLASSRKRDDAPMTFPAGGQPPAGGPGAPSGPAGPSGGNPGTNGPNGGPGGLTNQGQWQIDPALAGVNAHVRGLINSGANAQQIRAYLNSVSPGLGTASPGVDEAVRAHRDQPGRQINLDLERVWKPATPMQQAFGEAAATPFGTGAINAADMLSMGTLDNMTSNPAMTRAVMQGVNERNPNAALLGQLGGGALSALGAEGLAARLGLQGVNAARAADALYGGAYGAGSADEGSRLAGAAIGAGAGTAGGMFGRALGRAAGSAFQGVADPAVKALRDANIPMTVGQAMGGTAKGIEDRLAGMPLIGDAINARRREGMRAFNTAALNEAGAPIGATTTQTGEAGLRDILGAAGQSYQDAVRGVNVPLDAQFGADLAAARQAGAALPPDLAQRFDVALTNRIDPIQGAMTGDQFQQAMRGIKGYKAEATKPGFEQDYRDALGMTQDALRGVMNRNGGSDVVDALGRADQTYRMAKSLEKAVSAAKNGTGSGEIQIFTPAQLNTASWAAAKRYPGPRPMAELTDAAQAVLPSKVPDSGTAGRLAIPMMFGALGGGTGAIGEGDFADKAGTVAKRGLGLGLLAAVPYSKAAQKAAVKLLVNERPAVLQALGSGIANRAANAGQLGVAGGLDLSMPYINLP